MTLTYSKPIFKIIEDPDEDDVFADEKYFAINSCEKNDFYCMTECLAWCYENINGKFKIVDNSSIAMLIIFTDEDATMAFKLRWL